RRNPEIAAPNTIDSEIPPVRCTSHKIQPTQSGEAIATREGMLNGSRANIRIRTATPPPTAIALFPAPSGGRSMTSTDIVKKKKHAQENTSAFLRWRAKADRCLPKRKSSNKMRRMNLSMHVIRNHEKHLAL